MADDKKLIEASPFLKELVKVIDPRSMRFEGLVSADRMNELRLGQRVACPAHIGADVLDQHRPDVAQATGDHDRFVVTAVLVGFADFRWLLEAAEYVDEPERQQARPAAGGAAARAVDRSLAQRADRLVELLGHAPERLGQHAEFVAAVDRLPRRKVALRYRLRALSEQGKRRRQAPPRCVRLSQI